MRYSSFFEDFKKPFEFLLKRKGVIITLNDEGLVKCLDIGDGVCPETDVEIRNRLCTDFNVYRSILFHLIYNAIKFSPPNEIVNVEVYFKPLPNCKNSPKLGKLLGLLQTKITNIG